jgi:hypothetical protein
MYGAIAARTVANLNRAALALADCAELVLMRSDLKPTGPIYTPMLRANLERGEP